MIGRRKMMARRGCSTRRQGCRDSETGDESYSMAVCGVQPSRIDISVAALRIV
jgi:hypothetical protein